MTAEPRVAPTQPNTTVVDFGFGLVWFGLVWFGLVWFGLVWFGWVGFGLVGFVRGGV
jgi:hypothetical protein